jgi:hypothetical protein
MGILERSTTMLRGAHGSLCHSGGCIGWFKMKVTTQGGCHQPLWAVTPPGLEKDTYFEPGSTPAQMDYCLKLIRSRRWTRRVVGGWSQVHA